jgi:hypothetical protein
MAADLPVGRASRYTWLLGAYVPPALLVWAMLGLILSAIPVRLAALAVLAPYCAYYGTVEAAALPGLAAPGSRWQVPQSFVRGVSRRRRIIIWGTILGPGLMTRNPYAGFGALLLAVAASGHPTAITVAVAIGATHAAGRALALAHEAAKPDTSDYFRSALKSLHWRTIDGLALLSIAGVTAVALVDTLT